MTQRPSYDSPLKGTVVSFTNSTSAAKGTALKEAYRANEARLISFLMARLGSRAEAQDIAQSVFLKLWERSAELRDQNLVALIFVTARNLATDRLRSHQWQASSRRHADEGMSQLVDEAPPAERVVAARHDLKVIVGILQELPERCRAAFIRYKFEGESYQEIAAAMGVTESMIRKYVLRAVAHCATRFAQLEGWE